MSSVHLVLAHQGGWDELAFVLLPIALFAGLLAIANRRATRQQAELAALSDDVASEEAEPASDPPGDE